MKKVILVIMLAVALVSPAYSEGTNRVDMPVVVQNDASKPVPVTVISHASSQLQAALCPGGSFYQTSLTSQVFGEPVDELPLELPSDTALHIHTAYVYIERIGAATSTITSLGLTISGLLDTEDVGITTAFPAPSSVHVQNSMKTHFSFTNLDVVIEAVDSPSYSPHFTVRPGDGSTISLYTDFNTRITVKGCLYSIVP